jgi:hypothetical protein
MGVQPLGDRRDVPPDLVELDYPQRFVGTVVLQQRLEPLRGGQVLKGERALAAVAAREHPVVFPVRSVGACLPRPMLYMRFASLPT